MRKTKCFILFKVKPVRESSQAQLHFSGIFFFLGAPHLTENARQPLPRFEIGFNSNFPDRLVKNPTT